MPLIHSSLPHCKCPKSAHISPEPGVCCSSCINGHSSTKPSLNPEARPRPELCICLDSPDFLLFSASHKGTHSHSSRVFWLISALSSVFPHLGLCVDQHFHCFDFGLTCISDSESLRSFTCNRTEVSTEDTILTSLQVTTHCRNSNASHCESK